ncbi:MAG: RAD55 family ATPase [Haloferacaceae archaeon]
MASTGRRFSTGLQFLDRLLDGGIPAGSLLALHAPPASQSELLLRELVSIHRTLYVPTLRPAAEVTAWAEAAPGDVDLRADHRRPDDLLADPDSLIHEADPESLLVVDPVDGVEAGDREAYVDFLTRLKRHLRETDGVGVLHCIDRGVDSPARGTTLKRADDVWRIELVAGSREIKTRLLVTKSRWGRALTEPVPILMTDRVRIDTSRRIA